LDAERESADDLYFDAGRLRGGLPVLHDAQLGLIRNLTAGEIVGQILVALRENKEERINTENTESRSTEGTEKSKDRKQTNVVLMGQGEPLLNYENVMAAMRIVLDPKRRGAGAEACNAVDERDCTGD